MNDPNRMMKWLLVIGMVVLSLLVLYPPSEKLKGGIDLVGGTSLLLEIDTTGLDAEQQKGLSTRVMRILKERVDPNGQLNIEWRPVGNTRLEIRMPRPPKEALARREVYNTAFERLRSKNVKRRGLERALNAPREQRQEKLSALQLGVEARRPALEAVADAFDELITAKDTSDTLVIEAAEQAYEEAIAAVLETNLPVNRLKDVLVLTTGKRREEELNRFREAHPSFDAGSEQDQDGKLLTKTVSAYDAWAADKAELEDPSDLKRRLRGAGVLEFWILADRDPGSPANTFDPKDAQLQQPIRRYTDQLARYGSRPQAGDRFRWVHIDDVQRFLNIKDMEVWEGQKDQPGRPIVEEYAGRYYVLTHNDPGYRMLHAGAGKGQRKWKLVSAFSDRNPMTGQNVVSFRLDPRGGRLFGELTGNNVNRSLCIMLDDAAVSHAVIQERITERCQISGDFTPDRVQDLVTMLEAGSLPARLKETPLSEVTIGPSLGKTNREKGLRAAKWGAGAVALFVLIYYGIAAGGMTNIALAMNLLFVLSIMALMQATFTLPGIAGLILTVGMAIDANVLIFERIREERDRGIPFKKALNAGYDKAFSTILDANLTTLITCVVLGFVGSQEVKGFALVLGLGITTSMFTSLFVTRLVFNTLIAKGWLKDFRMLRIIRCPSIDWLAMRRFTFPVSTVAVILGMGLFIIQSVRHKEAIYDIEFLGGTSVQIDLKPNVHMTDEEVRAAVTATEGESAVQWLRRAAQLLPQGRIGEGELPGQFTFDSAELTGEQSATLLSPTLQEHMEGATLEVVGRTVMVTGRAGKDTVDSFSSFIQAAAERVQVAADRLRSARVQSVESLDAAEGAGLSYEVSTIETNRELVQQAIVAVLGQRLSVQQAINYTTVRDEVLTQDEFYIVEVEDRYLSDVIGGEASFDVRSYRGGVAIQVVLDELEDPLPVAELDRRLLEVALQPEFEQLHTRESEVIPLGEETDLADGRTGYRRFAIVAVDEALLYDADPILAGQWMEEVAAKQVELVKAALGSEKSLSKVIQFAPQIAGQTRDRAIFAIVLALLAIVSYLWLRFGSKEYGLAAIVALVHDVSITLGLVALSYYVYDTIIGTTLLIDDFKVDLPMVAAILTVIGYSLNDTIVVFDRIRENRGKVSGLTASVINQSLNQTLSRTVLTSMTTFLVVCILYVIGGKGVHGFSFALMIGVVVGTYSSIGIATPLLYQPKLLRAVVVIIVALGVMGIIVAQVDSPTTRWVMVALTAGACILALVRSRHRAEPMPAGHPVRA
ncbi:MAG: protein translocase subunit SecD [Planctomycetes bacterium]|nr:protein translocase subunit SecD [Planctomycetota bacterium]